MTSEDRDSLLLELHLSAVSNPPWTGFLRLCATRLRLCYASLIFRRGRDRAVDAEFFAGDAVTQEMKLVYRQRFASLDPISYHAMQAGRCYRLPELHPDPDFAQHPFYRGFLEPAGIAHMLTARVVETSGESAWLSLSRSREQGDFTAAEQALVESLLPHMAVALHGFVLLDRHRVQAAIGRHVSTRFDMAAISLTARGKVLGMGPTATAILAGTQAMRIDRDGRLRLGDRLEHRRFEDAVAMVLQNGHSRPLLLESGSQRIEILVAPFVSEAARGVARPDVVLYIRRERHAAAKDDIRQSLTAMFGLTKIEAEIAMGLADGQRMGAVAAGLGLAESTVRSYSKSIYAKLGVRRQVDLVRLLLLSVAQLA